MAAAKGMISVTKTKESPDQSVGVTLKQDEDGAVFIKKISKSGLFHHTDLEVDDKVLSINGKRIDKKETLEEYMEATLDDENVTKITIVARKPSAWGKGGGQDKQDETNKFKREIRMSAGGTPAPFDQQYKNDPEEEDKKQVMVKGIKQEEGQDVGVTFVKVGDKLFVSGISPESIFHFSKKPKKGSAELEFGDRIVAVNETNFMSYADVTLALKLLAKRSVMEPELYVEKGWNVLGPGHVDPIHFDPTLVRGGKARYAPDVKEETSDDSEVEISESEDEQEGSKVAKPEMKQVAPPPKDDDEPVEDKMWWDM